MSRVYEKREGVSRRRQIAITILMAHVRRAPSNHENGPSVRVRVKAKRPVLSTGKGFVQ